MLLADLIEKVNEIKARIGDSQSKGAKIINAIDIESSSKTLLYETVNKALIEHALFEFETSEELKKSSHLYKMDRLYCNMRRLIEFIKEGEDDLDADEGSTTDYAGNYKNDDFSVEQTFDEAPSIVTTYEEEDVEEQDLVDCLVHSIDIIEENEQPNLDQCNEDVAMPTEQGVDELENKVITAINKIGNAEQATKYWNLAKATKFWWEKTLINENMRVYEHMLFDHGAIIVAKYPNGNFVL